MEAGAVTIVGPSALIVLQPYIVNEAILIAIVLSVHPGKHAQWLDSDCLEKCLRQCRNEGGYDIILELRLLSTVEKDKIEPFHRTGCFLCF